MDFDFEPVEPHTTLPYSPSFLSYFDTLVVDSISTEDGAVIGKHYTTLITLHKSQFIRTQHTIKQVASVSLWGHGHISNSVIHGNVCF